MSKHFTKGIVIGRIIEIKDEPTKENGKKYVNINVDISGTLSGDVTAYCRMYDKDDCISELKQLWQKNRQGLFKLQGIYSQYQKDQSSEFLSNFTLFSFESIEASSRRAYFIVAGTVSSQPSGTTDGGQRFLVEVIKKDNKGNNKSEIYEFFSPGDKLLDSVSDGDAVRVKGLIRHKDPDGVCGGDGPIRAYLESLEIQSEDTSASDEDIPY